MTKDSPNTNNNILYLNVHTTSWSFPSNKLYQRSFRVQKKWQCRPCISARTHILYDISNIMTYYFLYNYIRRGTGVTISTNTDVPKDKTYLNYTSVWTEFSRSNYFKVEWYNNIIKILSIVRLRVAEIDVFLGTKNFII